MGIAGQRKTYGAMNPGEPTSVRERPDRADMPQSPGQHDQTLQSKKMQERLTNQDLSFRADEDVLQFEISVADAEESKMRRSFGNLSTVESEMSVLARDIRVVHVDERSNSELHD